MTTKPASAPHELLRCCTDAAAELAQRLRVRPASGAAAFGATLLLAIASAWTLVCRA